MSTGDEGPPTKASTIKDVARVAGVSLGTVSNVINKPELVSPELRERVLAVVERLHYVPNESARRLRKGGPYASPTQHHNGANHSKDDNP